MPWLDILWTAENEDHIRENGVTCEEVEYVLHNPVGYDMSESSERPIVFGSTPAGRKLAVVYELVDPITVYPITAFEVE